LEAFFLLPHRAHSINKVNFVFWGKKYSISRGILLDLPGSEREEAPKEEKKGEPFSLSLGEFFPVP
jgi:hypothetical protein